MSRARPAGDGARSAARAAGARPRRRCSAWCAASCTATTVSTCASGSGVAAIEGDGRVERVRLDDGTTVDADVVVVGVGCRARRPTGSKGSGLTLDNGVVCDETLLAAPGIVAAGDVGPVAEPALRRRADAARALDQRRRTGRRRGAPAARARGRGPAEPYAPVPFVWSDQYDRKIQTVGHFRGDDEMEVVYGTLEETPVRRGVRPRRAPRRRARVLDAGQGDAVPEDDRGARARSPTPSTRAARREARRPSREPCRRCSPRRFVVVVISGFCYFSALGTILPVVPRYVDKQLGGNDVAVGLGGRRGRGRRHPAAAARRAVRRPVRPAGADGRRRVDRRGHRRCARGSSRRWSG